MTGERAKWLKAGVQYESIDKLIGRQAPKSSAIGLALAVVSLVVMPALARGKKFVPSRIESRTLGAGAMETVVCAYLSFTLLLGLALNALYGWWWADPVAALLVLPVLLREGWEAVREANEEREEGEG